ncbi:hypothetical protein BABINDRAFT_164150 [Babjeviella inositovora NRRL Y-12698]|uniref:ferric-chelate reductase (NADPH) n=1 Tax=Babjeviella inositovora NRRL Y-12698 TaxID=984486 RepID=A0A1E3QXK1_9ASCO|nr:uncharacterized protein BABINDRAFT_164150 [Babjeviella inositovora NRRL Y-12698]ODQ82341.1 hypothetical protein BABINDRAFT_164150 [Babjeviella inositovora NRRL Y-12698]
MWDSHLQYYCDVQAYRTFVSICAGAMETTQLIWRYGLSCETNKKKLKDRFQIHPNWLLISVFITLSWHSDSTPSLLLRRDYAEKLNMRLSPISYAKPTHITPLLLLLLLGASPKGTDAKKWGGEERTIIYSCQISLTQYEYACTSDLWWGCTCTYPPQLGALLQCSSQYSPSANIFNDSLSVIQEFCSEFALHHWEIGDLRAQTLNASGYVIGDQDGAATGAPFYVPVLPPKAKVLGYKKAYDVFFGSLDLNSKLASGILGFWGSILLAVSLFNNVLKRFRWSHSFFAANRWSSRFRAVVTVPTLFQGGRHKTDTIWGLIPTRFESIILVLYLIVDVYLTVIRYHIFDPNLLFLGRTMQMLKYLADRTGTIAFDHLPLLILFAGRNNLLIKFTGLPYSTFLAFHRWTARGMFLNAFIHSVSYSMYMALQKSYFTEYMDPYWICGVCATASAGILIASSTYYLRKYYYELFLISHIVLALIFLVACLLHQYLMPYPFDVSMVWLALTLWGLDRAIRLYSVLRFGIKIADLTLVDDETIVIKITDRPSHWQPKPGNFVYITFLTPRMAWESHPFTICDSVFQDREVSIYMKVKKGITSRLREKIIRDSEKAATTPLLRDGISKTISLRVCVDGPYVVSRAFTNMRYQSQEIMLWGKRMSGCSGLFEISKR